jgi:hypothetical protein
MSDQNGNKTAASETEAGSENSPEKAPETVAKATVPADEAAHAPAEAPAESEPPYEEDDADESDLEADHEPPEHAEPAVAESEAEAPPVKERRRGGAVKLIAYLIAIVAAGGGGYYLWNAYLADLLPAMIGLAQAPEQTTETEKPAPEASVAPTESKTSDENTASESHPAAVAPPPAPLAGTAAPSPATPEPAGGAEAAKPAAAPEAGRAPPESSPHGESPAFESKPATAPAIANASETPPAAAPSSLAREAVVPAPAIPENQNATAAGPVKKAEGETKPTPSAESAPPAGQAAAPSQLNPPAEAKRSIAPSKVAISEPSAAAPAAPKPAKAIEAEAPAPASAPEPAQPATPAAAPPPEAAPASAPPPAPAGAPKSESAEALAAMAAKVAAAEATVERLSQRLQSVEGELGALKSEASAAPPSHAAGPDKAGEAAARLVVAQSLLSALRQGDDYTAQIAALQKFGADPERLARLRAGLNAPAMEALAKQFTTLGPRLLEAAAPAKPAEKIKPPRNWRDAIWARIETEARELVRIRPAGSADQDATAAEIAKIEKDLRAGDLTAALADRQQLPPPALNLSKDWAAAVQTRIDAVSAAKAELAAALRDLAETKS